MFRAMFRNGGDYYNARTTRSLAITSCCNPRQMKHASCVRYNAPKAVVIARARLR